MHFATRKYLLHFVKYLWTSHDTLSCYLLSHWPARTLWISRYIISSKMISSQLPALALRLQCLCCDTVLVLVQLADILRFIVKAIPGQTPRFPGWGSQISRQVAHESGKFVRLTHRPLPTKKYSWYSFLLEAESTPGPYCGRKDVIEKFRNQQESNPLPSGL